MVARLPLRITFMTEQSQMPLSETAPVEQATQAAKSMPPVLLKGGIKIFPGNRLPQFDRGELKAYEATGVDGGKAFAIICEKNIVPQAEIIHKYAGIITPHLPKLIGCGVVDWTPNLREHFAIVYENKLGNPIMSDKNPAAMGIKAELAISTIFRNLLDAVRSMHDKGIAHGNIRVQNIFDGGSGAYEGAMLGECLSAPTGYGQSIIYETIPRALASPLGRGGAEYSDDIYALGVTMAALIRTHDPAEGLSDDEIIYQKIDMGSFNFIAGKDRFPAPILEFMRGTLNDDPALRWTYDDILTWAEGRRVSAKQGAGIVALKASRPLEFNHKKFLRPQALSVAFSKDVAAAVPPIENGELFLWINRSLQDKELEGRYEEAMSNAKNGGSGAYADKLACSMAIALYPENPIFYRGHRFFPTAFGNMLVNAVYNKKDMASFVDVIQSNVVSFWSKCSKFSGDGVGDAVNRIGNCQRLLAQNMIGYGIERCIYYLSPMAPCLSDKLADFYVRSAEDYLKAMEVLSTSKKRPEWFLDRHIVAFLSVRDKSIIEPYLADIAASERYRQRHGVLKVMAAIQQRDKIGALPGLSAWISSLLDVLIERYHDREKRKKIKSQLEKIKDKGDLARIAALFDNFDEIQMDMKTFSLSMQQYQDLKREALVLANELDTNPKFGMEAGRQVATLVSGAIAALVVVIYLIFSISSGGGKIF